MQIYLHMRFRRLSKIISKIIVRMSLKKINKNNKCEERKFCSKNVKTLRTEKKANNASSKNCIHYKDVEEI